MANARFLNVIQEQKVDELSSLLETSEEARAFAVYDFGDALNPETLSNIVLAWIKQGQFEPLERFLENPQIKNIIFENPAIRPFDELCHELVHYFLALDPIITDEIRNKMEGIRILIKHGAHYQNGESPFTEKGPLLLEIANSLLYEYLLEERGKAGQNKNYLSFRKKLHELRGRVFLAHRFGLKTFNNLSNETILVDGISFSNVIRVLKNSYQEFVDTDENISKLIHLLMQQIKQATREVPETAYFRITESLALKMIEQVSQVILDLGTKDYFEKIHHKLHENEVLIVPFKTSYPGHTFYEYHAEALAIFSDRLLKLNRKGITTVPGITVYKTTINNLDPLVGLTQQFLNSFKDKPLVYESWDTELNSLLQTEKVHFIAKKEKVVGNSSWSTAKLIVYAAVFGIVYQQARKISVKPHRASNLATSIADVWYKLFSMDDRNRAVRDYLTSHGMLIKERHLMVADRIQYIRKYLSKESEKEPEADREELFSIYLKSLNWLLSDYLKRGEMESAQKLIKSEMLNTRWNPLIYAARKGKLALAEFLANNPTFINRKDESQNTPLHLAVVYGRLEICKTFCRYLKTNQLNLRAQNEDGNTVLHLAAIYNRSSIAEYLLKLDPELINIMNAKGESPLSMACLNESMDVISLLLKKGAKLEGLDMTKFSPEVVRVLENKIKALKF